MSNIINIIKQAFSYQESNNYDFILSDTYTSTNSENNEISQNIFPDFLANLEFIKTQYSTLINSDIKLREFILTFECKKYKAFLFYIDGMINSESINRFVLNPLMLKNSHLEIKTSSDNISVVKKNNIQTFITDSLLPQNDVTVSNSFLEIFKQVNSGVTALFVDTLNDAFLIDAKGFETRSISTPENEYIVRGPQECFIESIRTNTSLIRRIINNQNLIIENLSVGKLSNTSCCICYMKNITNPDLVAEVKYRISNLSIDSITSSGELEQLIQDSSFRCSTAYFYRKT